MEKLLLKDAVLRIGEVLGIEGRTILIAVDKNKNSSDLLFDGQVIKNISVGGYLEVRKGFLSIIGKVTGEKLSTELFKKDNLNSDYEIIDKNKRILTISLIGYLNHDGKFIGGIKELPLIGNEAYILTEEKIHRIHSLVSHEKSLSIKIAKTDIEEVDVEFPIDGIFNSHIAIFGNTGSGKSNTLAALYQAMYKELDSKSGLFCEKSNFLLFDFNGEYTSDDCITDKKKVYNLSTRDDSGDKIPITLDDLFDLETFSLLVEATDKTQKPFIKRTLKFYKSAKSKHDFCSYLKKIVENRVVEVLSMPDRDVAHKLLDYLNVILHFFLDDDTESALRDDIVFHNTGFRFKHKTNHEGRYIWLDGDKEKIEETNYFKAVQAIDYDKLEQLGELEKFNIFLHLQLIQDLYTYKVRNDHIYPAINRIIAKQRSIERIFKITDDNDFWGNHNFVSVNLHDVNLEMRKTIPLLLAKNMYRDHKSKGKGYILNIIVDEAHNILSKESFRETNEWKDYRLETFEEIIKEGRKFGVFLTISSQRPNDISDTIISQAHNYFIHQLVNHRDLATIGNAVSYIDRITEESIPTLPVGTCILSGVVTHIPLKLKIKELPDKQKPESMTIRFDSLLGRTIKKRKKRKRK